jgi:hypothetical protein
MKTIISVFLFCLSIQAQVNVLFTPESGTATAANFGKGKGVGIWTVMLSNEGAARVILSAEKVYMAAPGVPWFGPNRAQLLLTNRYENKPRNKVARLLTFGADNAEATAGAVAVMMAGKVIAASTGWQVGITAAIPVFHKVAALINQTEPPLAGLFGTVLMAPVTLEAGAGATFTAFASTFPSPKPVAATILPAAK